MDDLCLMLKPFAQSTYTQHHHLLKQHLFSNISLHNNIRYFLILSTEPMNTKQDKLIN